MMRHASKLAALGAIVSLAGCADQASLKGFPAEYVGRWGEDADGCSPGAIHGGLTIEPRLVADGEFSGKVESVVRKPDGSLYVVETWELPESPPTKLKTNYSLSKDGASLTVDETEGLGETPSGPYVLIRCKARHV
jgi:hypothetical protein